MGLVRYYSDYTILQFQVVYLYKALSKLVTLDAKSLYTSIPNEEDINIIKTSHSNFSIATFTNPKTENCTRLYTPKQQTENHASTASHTI